MDAFTAKTIICYEPEDADGFQFRFTAGGKFSPEKWVGDSRQCIVGL